MTTIEVLKAARARIERGWCQKRYARAADGLAAPERAPYATQWCTAGAVYAAAPNILVAEIAFQPLVSALGDCRLADWNDEQGRTQADVLALYDKAIALAEAATSRDAAGMKR